MKLGATVCEDISELTGISTDVHSPYRFFTYKAWDATETFIIEQIDAWEC